MFIVKMSPQCIAPQLPAFRAHPKGNKHVETGQILREIREAVQHRGKSGDLSFGAPSAQAQQARKMLQRMRTADLEKKKDCHGHVCVGAWEQTQGPQQWRARAVNGRQGFERIGKADIANGCLPHAIGFCIRMPAFNIGVVSFELEISGYSVDDPPLVSS